MAFQDSSFPQITHDSESVPDAPRGHDGVCDFVLARSLTQHVSSAPLMATFEAKER